MIHRFSRNFRIFLAALAASLVFSAFSASAAVATETRTVSPFGMCSHMLWGYSNTAIDNELNLMKAAGSTWVRLDVSWRDMEPANNSYNAKLLASLDHVVAAASARGMKVLPVVMEFPDWTNGTKGMWVPPTNDANFTDFMKFMAARYNGKIAYWEIMNEVNEADFFAVARTASPARYTALLKAGYAGVKQGSPAAQVISAGLAGSDYNYLQEMYDAGAQGAFDILGVHPYTRGRSPYATDANTPSSTFDGMAIMKSTMERNGDPTKKIWITEAGWQTSNVNYKVTQDLQAQYTYEAFQRIYESFPYVETLFTYGIRNNGTDMNVSTDNYGLMSNTYVAKPAYAAYRRAFEAFGQIAVPVANPGTPSTSTVASSVTIKRNVASVYLPRFFVLSGVKAGGQIGDEVVVYVKKPGSPRWAYSSARLVFSEAGDWWYRYTPKLRGTYSFQAKVAGSATAASAASTYVSVTVR